MEDTLYDGWALVEVRLLPGCRARLLNKSFAELDTAQGFDAV